MSSTIKTVTGGGSKGPDPNSQNCFKYRIHFSTINVDLVDILIHKNLDPPTFFFGYGLGYHTTGA